VGVFPAGRKQAQMAMIRNRIRIVRCLFIISSPRYAPERMESTMRERLKSFGRGGRHSDRSEDEGDLHMPPHWTHHTAGTRDR